MGFAVCHLVCEVKTCHAEGVGMTHVQLYMFDWFAQKYAR